MTENIPSGILDIIRNDDGSDRYDGNLMHYFRVVFFQAQNLRHPYHNFRHMLHVLWLCNDACDFYRTGKAVYYICRREARTLLIAALFHDFDHSGQTGNDDLNITRAIRGFRKHIAPEDKPYAKHIETLIRTTEFPHKTPGDKLTILGQILRDADMSQALDIAWIQQVIFGLAAEWGKPPMEVLKAQDGFHRNLVFQTDWAKAKFPQEVIDKKIAEANGFIQLLEGKPHQT